MTFIPEFTKIVKQPILLSDADSGITLKSGSNYLSFTSDPNTYFNLPDATANNAYEIYVNAPNGIQLRTLGTDIFIGDYSGSVIKISVNAELLLRAVRINPPIPIGFWETTNLSPQSRRDVDADYVYADLLPSSSSVDSTYTANAPGLLVIPGLSMGDLAPVIDQTVLVLWSDDAPSGLYTIVDVGSVSTPWILRRFDTDTLASSVSSYSITTQPLSGLSCKIETLYGSTIQWSGPLLPHPITNTFVASDNIYPGYCYVLDAQSGPFSLHLLPDPMPSALALNGMRIAFRTSGNNSGNAITITGDYSTWEADYAAGGTVSPLVITDIGTDYREYVYDSITSRWRRADSTRFNPLSITLTDVDDGNTLKFDASYVAALSSFGLSFSMPTADGASSSTLSICSKTDVPFKLTAAGTDLFYTQNGTNAVLEVSPGENLTLRSFGGTPSIWIRSNTAQSTRQYRDVDFCYYADLPANTISSPGVGELITASASGGLFVPKNGGGTGVLTGQTVLLPFSPGSGYVYLVEDPGNFVNPWKLRRIDSYDDGSSSEWLVRREPMEGLVFRTGFTGQHASSVFCDNSVRKYFNDIVITTDQSIYPGRFYDIDASAGNLNIQIMPDTLNTHGSLHGMRFAMRARNSGNTITITVCTGDQIEDDVFTSSVSIVLIDIGNIYREWQYKFNNSSPAGIWNLMNKWA